MLIVANFLGLDSLTGHSCRSRLFDSQQQPHKLLLVTTVRHRSVVKASFTSEHSVPKTHRLLAVHDYRDPLQVSFLGSANVSMLH